MNGWLEDFDWESDEQRKGVLAFLGWARSKRLGNDVRPIDVYLIQKDHESDVYWRELVGDQVSKLEDQIRLLQLELRELKQRVGDKI